jgi:small GTP-binding protein
LGTNEASKEKFKVAVLGEGGVGKSAFTCRYVFQKFLREYINTIEDFYTKSTSVDNKQVELDILDTAGMEEFRAVRDAMIRDREGFLMIFDLTNMESFERIDYLMSLVKAYHSSPTGAPCILIGNKSDKRDERVVTNEMAVNKANQYSIPYFESSALSGINIEESFNELVRELRKKFNKKEVP